MSCNNVDMIVFMGSDFEITLTIDDANGDPVDIAGADYIMQARDSAGNLIADFSYSVESVTSAMVTFSLSASVTGSIDTSDLPVRRVTEFADQTDEISAVGGVADYQTDIIYSDGKREMIMAGRLCFVEDVAYD